VYGGKALVAGRDSAAALRLQTTEKLFDQTTVELVKPKSLNCQPSLVPAMAKQ
jgi:hypothetical protein